MADREEDNQQEKGGGGRKVLLAVGFLAVAAAGAGGAMLWQRFQTPSEPEPSAEGSQEASESRLAEERAARLVAMEPLVVNLGGSGVPRYLKVQLELEVVDVASRGAVEVSVPVVRDALIVLLGSQRLADLQEFEGKILLKEEILDRVNGALGEPLVDSVFFTEFIVQ